MDSSAFADEVMRDRGLVANGSGTSTFGTFDGARVQEMIDIVTPVFDGTENFEPSITAGDLFTNEFIDESIGFAQ